MRINIARLFLAILLIATATTVPATARGKRLPPPRFTGGNIGAWLPRGSLFNNPDYPLGPGFGEPMDGKDEDPIGGGTGWDWDPFDGEMGGNGGPGCPGNCNFETMTGPCKPICECYVQMSDHQGTPQEDVEYAYGSCVSVGYYPESVDSSCKNEFDKCTVAIRGD